LHFFPDWKGLCSFAIKKWEKYWIKLEQNGHKLTDRFQPKADIELLNLFGNAFNYIYEVL